MANVLHAIVCILSLHLSLVETMFFEDRQADSNFSFHDDDHVTSTQEQQEVCGWWEGLSSSMAVDYVHIFSL